MRNRSVCLETYAAIRIPQFSIQQNSGVSGVDFGWRAGRIVPCAFGSKNENFEKQDWPKRALCRAGRSAKGSMKLCFAIL